MDSRAKTLFLPAWVDIKDDCEQGNMHGSLPSVKGPNNNILFTGPAFDLVVEQFLISFVSINTASLQLNKN